MVVNVTGLLHRRRWNVREASALTGTLTQGRENVFFVFSLLIIFVWRIIAIVMLDTALRINLVVVMVVKIMVLK